MGNKFSQSKPRSQKNNYSSSGVNSYNQQHQQSDNSSKIGISNIPANKMAPNNTSTSTSKEFGSIIKEIKKNPELRNLERLPKESEESLKLKNSIELITKNLKESDSMRANSRGSLDFSGSSCYNSDSNTSRLSSSGNIDRQQQQKQTRIQAGGSEDLSLKRQKLIEQLQRLNELENEKQIKLLEQERDLYVENLKLQDSFMVQESLSNYYKNSKDQTMSSFNAGRGSSKKKIISDSSSSGDEYPFIKAKIDENHQLAAEKSLVPVYVETRIPKLVSVYKRAHSPIYTNVPLHNSTLDTDLNTAKTTNDYFSNESYKLSDKELDLILTAIMRYEKEEVEKRLKNPTGNANKTKPCRYFYKDKQIYPNLDKNVLLNKLDNNDSKRQSENMKEKVLKDLKIVNETNQLLKKSSLNETKLSNSFSNNQNHSHNQSIVSTASTTVDTINNTSSSTIGSTTNNNNGSRSSLSQVLKDIIIEFSNMSEDDFQRFKIELNNEMELAKKREARKMVEEQQKLLEKQKIPERVLKAYKNPYYEHCSDIESIINSSSYSSDRPKSLFYDNKYYLTVDSSMKKSQSLNLNNCNQSISNNDKGGGGGVQRKNSNLKKLASRKGGEKIDENEEELYDPINYKFDEEIYH